MNAIEKITADILAKGQKEVESYRQEEKQALEEQFQIQMLNLERKSEQTLVKKQQMLGKSFQEKQQKRQIETRQSLLNKKQELLQCLFQAATEKMNSWEEEEFLSFFQTAANNCALSGDVHVIVGSISSSYLTEKKLTDLSTSEYTLLLSSEQVAQAGGFILEQGGIEYNFLFSEIIRQFQDTESYEVAARLFH